MHAKEGMAPRMDDVVMIITSDAVEGVGGGKGLYQSQRSR